MDAERAKDAEPEAICPPWVRGLDAPPGTAWTRADALRVGDLVSVGDDSEDRLARVVAVESGDSPDRLRLRLAFELDGGLIVQCSQAPAASTRYLRRLPEPRSIGEVPRTTIEGLASAERIYEREWGADGAVVVHLPQRVADQLLRTRGWTRLGGPVETEAAWRSPAGESFSGTGDAVWMALTAEYADASVAQE